MVFYTPKDVYASLVGPNSLAQVLLLREPTWQEVEILEYLLDLYPPRTKLKPGDIVARRTLGFPDLMQVRFVVSYWQHEVYTAMHEHAGEGLDWLADFVHARIERQYVRYHGLGDLRYLTGREHRQHEQRLLSSYRNAFVYVHGAPHGFNPDSAEWVDEPDLIKIPLRGDTVVWPQILDAFNVPFLGYDTREYPGPAVLDMAPDLYGQGVVVDQPLPHEEQLFQSMCAVGLEHLAVAPIDARALKGFHKQVIMESIHDLASTSSQDAEITEARGSF